MRLAASFTSLVCLSSALVAQEKQDTTVLHPIVVTATRVPIAEQAAPVSVTVIRGEDLRARGITTVSEALASVAGLSVVQSGSFGATTALFARGGESDYVKVLMDGVTLNSPGGGFDFATLTTDNLDRIEIVRGPASVTYGADAVAGVVQLFTRRGSGAARGYTDVRGGSFGTIEEEAGVSGAATTTVAYAIGGGNRQTDGFLPFNNDYWNRTASGRLSFSPARGTIDLTARRTDAAYHFPTDGSGAVVDSNAVRRDHRTVLGIDALGHVTSRLDVHAFGGASRLDGGSSNAPDSPGDTTGFYGNDDARIDRRSGELRADLRATRHATVSIGTVLEREQARSRSESQFARFPSSETTFSSHRTNKSAYAQVIGVAAARLTYTASGRIDATSTYGTFTTARASMAWQFASGTSVRAAVGNAFKAPAFDETFSSAFTIGNPGLEPERTSSWEASAERRIGGRSVVTATYFDQRFRDLIQYVLGDESTDFRGTNQNLGAATARGLELEARATRLGRLDLAGNLTMLRTRVTDAGNGAFGTFVDGDRLLRRPSRSAALTADYHFVRSGRLGVTMRYVGSRDDRDFANDIRVELPAYTLFDVNGEVSLEALGRGMSPFTLTARVENALDRDYQSAFGFDAPGRRVLVGARASLGGR